MAGFGPPILLYLSSASFVGSSNQEKNRFASLPQKYRIRHTLSKKRKKCMKRRTDMRYFAGGKMNNLPNRTVMKSFCDGKKGGKKKVMERFFNQTTTIEAREYSSRAVSSSTTPRSTSRESARLTRISPAHARFSASGPLRVIFGATSVA